MSSETDTLTNNKLYYSIYKSRFNDSLKFLIGDKKVAIYGYYSYGFNEITGGLLRLTVLGNPHISNINNNIYIESNITKYMEIIVGAIDCDLIDINTLINTFKIYKQESLIERTTNIRLIIENTLSITNYKISLVELIISRRRIPRDEMEQFLRFSTIAELFNLYYN